MGMVFLTFALNPGHQSIAKEVKIGYDPDRPGELPSDLLSLAPDRFVLINHYKQRFYFIDDTGRSVEPVSIAIPEDFSISSELPHQVITYPDRVDVLDSLHSRKISFPRSSSRGGQLPTTVTAIDMSDDERKMSLEFIRNTGASATSRFKDSGHRLINLRVRALGPGYLMSVVPIGQDGNGIWYSLAREVHIVDGKISVRMTAGRHQQGRRTLIVDLPVKCFDRFPVGSYVTPTPDGKIAYIFDTRSGNKNKLDVVIKELGETPKTRLPVDFDCRQASPNTEVADFGTNVDDDFVELRDMPTELSVNDRIILNRRPSIQKMKSIIGHYLKTKFMVTEDNYGGQSTCSLSDPWARPYSIKRELINKEETMPMPYAWGRSDSPTEFVKSISRANPSRIGNVCSKAKSSLSNTAGVDCSGLVSNIWGFPHKRDSETIQKRFTTPIQGFNEISFGDIYNLPKKHVRMHMDSIDNKEVGGLIGTIESTTACGGVCQRALYIENFEGYYMLRQKGR